MDFSARDLAHRHDIVRIRGHRNERLELAQIDLVFNVIDRVRIGFEFDPVLFALLAFQEAAYLVIRGKNRSRGTKLCAHVCNNMAIHRRQACHSRSVVLDDSAFTAVRLMTPQHLQDDIFGRYPIGEGSRESDPPDRRHFYIERLSSDSHGDFQAAGAYSEHPDCSCCRCMTVGAEHCLPWLAESFLMYRMADAIAGPAIPDPEPLTCSQKEKMIVGILMVLLNEIVVNILAGQFRSCAVQSHRLQFEHHESPGRILCQRLVDANPDFLSYRH